MTEQFMPKKTDKDVLDELITWYEQNKPEAGKVIKVRFSEKELEKFANATATPNTYSYRERLLERAP
jgi:hypothetical protein